MSEDKTKTEKKKVILRNLGDENLAPIESREYIRGVLAVFRITRTQKNINNDLDFKLSEKYAQKVIEDAILRIHRNKDYPENYNVFLAKDKLYMYENNKWAIVPHSRFTEVKKRTFSRIIDMMRREMKIQNAGPDEMNGTEEEFKKKMRRELCLRKIFLRNFDLPLQEMLLT